MTEISFDGVLVDVGNKNEKFEKYPTTKIAWDIKGAGVASTVVQQPVGKYQVREALQREHNNNMIGNPDPFSESLRGKRTLLHHSQLSKNSKALDRLKEKIQRQKNRSPVAAEKLSRQQLQQPSVSFLEDTELCTRKITKGPTAPKYKGFSSAKTRVKTVSAQANRQATPSDLYCSRPRNEAKPSDIRISRVEVPTKRSRVSGRDSASLDRKTLITPSSWRQGQHIAESILGPAVRHPRQTRKQDSSVSRAQVEESNVSSRPVSAPPVTKSAVRHKRPEFDMEPEKEKQPKVRHYDQNAVQEYIVKKKEERKRKKSQERKAHKEAQAKKQKQLEELYRRQKKYAVSKRKHPVDDENCPPDEGLQSSQPFKLGTYDRVDTNENIGAEEYGSLPRFDQRANEIMEKLTSLGTKTTTVKQLPATNEETMERSGSLRHKTNAAKQLSSSNDDSSNTLSLNLPKDLAPSEFMRKLDQYLDSSHTGFEGFGKQTSSRSGQLYSERPDYLRNEFSSSCARPVAYSTIGQNASPSASWAKKSGVDMSPANEYLSNAKMRAERIAALKTRADSLNEKMEVTLKMVEQPIIPSSRNLDDVDKILRKDPCLTSVSSLPNVDEILRKYDVERSLTSLPGANLRSNWSVPVENRIHDDPVLSPMKHESSSPEPESFSKHDDVMSEHVEEPFFQLGFRAPEKLPDPVSSESSSSDNQDDEIRDHTDHAEEYNPFEMDHFDNGKRDVEEPRNVPTPKTRSVKAPWETSAGDKHSIINLCVGRIIKDKGSRSKTEGKDFADFRARSAIVNAAADEMESEKSFTLSISKDISPTSTPKVVVPKKSPEQKLSGVSRSALKETQLPRHISTRSPVKSLPFTDEVDKFAVNQDSEINDEESLNIAKEETAVGGIPIEGVVGGIPIEGAAATTVPKSFKTTTQSATDYTQKFSPAALEQKLYAELNYQDSIDETLRHLTGVEKTQSTSAAQQDTVSLAQLVKTQQLLHGFELERERIKALSKIRQHQVPTDQRTGSSPSSTVSISRVTDGSSPTTEKESPRDKAKAARYKDSFSSSSSPTNSAKSGTDGLRKPDDDDMKRHVSRKDIEKYASDESESKSSYDGSRLARNSSKYKNKVASISTDLTSDSSATSVHFDESLTEDEIAEISLRAVVASEGHRRRHRSRSNAPLKKFEEGFENLKGNSRGNDKNSGEFYKFMDDLVQRYMQEEKFRAHHQAAMLHLRKRAIKEKTEAELAMLKKMKKQARKKGEDEKMPPLEKKQRAILRRYKMENAEIKKLKAIAKAESQERKLYYQQNPSRRGKRDEHSDLGADISDGVRKESKDILHSTSPDVADMDNSSVADSDISTSSSVLMKKLKCNVKGFDEQKLTKREQLLMKRKKQAEQLIAWKERLDREEQQVCSIEKKALRTWDKEIPIKQAKNKSQDKDSDPDVSSDSNVNTAASLTESSIAEEIASGAADSSASQSAVSGSIASRDEVRPRSSSSETIHEDDSQYSDFHLETEDVTKPVQSTVKKSSVVSQPLKSASQAEQPTNSKPSSDSKPPATVRKEPTETWSDESISQTPSETEQSDIECRVRALREELNRRRVIAEKLKKKQKQRQKDRLKAQEASLRSQIEAYDIFIRKTQDELKQELGGQPSGVVAKPQIRSPKKNHPGRQQLLQSETSAPSGHVNLASIGYQRSESESSDKSRANEDEEMANDASPSGSVKSGGVHEKSDSAIPKFNKQMTTGGISRSLFSTGAKPRSLIPVPSRNSASPKLSSMIVSPSNQMSQSQDDAIVRKSQETDVSSPTVSEKKLSESDDDISEHIDEISEVSSEKHTSTEQLPLLELNAAKEPFSVGEKTESEKIIDGELKRESVESSLSVSAVPEVEPAQDLLVFKVGDRVVVAGRDTGIVRFIGETSFAKGIWVGVELQSSIGKNDGSVNGIRYFTCSRNHGIFAPTTKITPLSQYSGQLPVSSRKEKISNFVKPTEDESESESSSESSRDSMQESVPSTKSMKEPTKRDNRKLADRLTSGLLDSLLEDSMDHILHQYSETKSKKTDDQPDDLRQEAAEQLISDADENEEQLQVNSDNKRHSTLADTFSDDLFRDTVEKVIEIRKQRALKWSSQDAEEEEEYDNIKSPLEGKLDYGKEVEDILGMKSGKLAEDDSDTEEKESMTPVRPVSPVLGVSQDEWIEDDIPYTSCLNKPSITRDFLSTDKESWQDGRLMEALSDFFEPSPVPKELAIDHDPERILKLVEDTVSAFYSKHVKGQDIDTFIPEGVFNETPKEDSDDSKIIGVTVKKKQDVDASNIFKMSLIDMVREFMMEIFAYKSQMETRSTTPKWQKKRVSNGPMYKKVPKSEEEMQAYITKKVSKLLNLRGSMDKRNTRIGMKWGSQKKKDRVDVILIRELREEEPDWTNYDEDETTVKMQLTETILDLILSDSIHCLNEIHSKMSGENATLSGRDI